MSGTRDRHTVPGTPRARLRSSLRVSLAVPVATAAAALTALGGWTAADLAGEGVSLSDQADRTGEAGAPAHALAARLQDERAATALWLAAPQGAERSALDAARRETDAAAEAFRESPASGPAAGRLDAALRDLVVRREAVDRRETGGTEAFRVYTDAVAEALGVLGRTPQGEDGRLAGGAAAAAALAQVAETVSRQETLAAVGVRPDATAAPAVREDLARALALQRQARALLDADRLPAAQAEEYERITATRAWALLMEVEAAGHAGTTALPAAPAEWREAAAGLAPRLRQAGADALGTAVGDAADRGTARVRDAALAGSAALLAALVSAVLAVRVVRSVTGRLAGLDREAADRAGTALPELIDWLGRTHEQLERPGGGAPERDYGQDEIGRLAGTLRREWQSIAEAVIAQARGREGAEAVFLGLARRTQVLINRIIPRLDTLEREHQDARLLKDIFEVDHLATRIRRHTENLLILGGVAPGRRWARPVPVYEVLRSAVSETEDYSRVEAPPAPPVSLDGRAVADVVHLLAELIENGTSFSPPMTKVSVSAQVVARGRVAIEVMDRGLGMSEAEYERLNRLLADPPGADAVVPGGVPRLGLFVVARLAARHGIEVSLRKSPYGGTLAVVLLPAGLLAEAKSLLAGGVSGPPAPREANARETAVRETTARPAGPSAPGPGEKHAGPAGELSARTALGWPARPRIPRPATRDPLAPGPADPPPRERYGRLPGAFEDLDHPALGAAGEFVRPPQSRPAPRPEEDDSGYPSYGGAGLLPGPPPGPEPEARTRPAGHPPVDPAAERPGRPAPPPPPAGLPVRVRGESLAGPLRAHNPPEPPPAPSSPDRAGSVMSAIQAGNRRARAERPGPPAARTPAPPEPSAGTPAPPAPEPGGSAPAPDEEGSDRGDGQGGQETRGRSGDE
ncbi:nitrate- and nitrite sensing domain-containing protein [Streptomyces sp. DSM 44917]|uniref:histidine kinase n=1 Tax=Streptomyces boetiae TaxID=3075541 RepID=A0ABU2L574_9ACTN|nr:nitrate- and nitrite sensing domain-containing protein [Streptomyces sp. DSM 44917]MDT0306383.1 nitrate- and nitrite sensing domain-containing protein [Streptomyces sp. DSM 44917]